MKIEKIESKSERTILTAMIVDDTVLSCIASRQTAHRLFKSRLATIVASWCIEHHTKYGKAPNRDIETLFASWQETVDDQPFVQSVAAFLTTLSQEYDRKEPVNSQYVIDMASDYFNAVSLERLADSVKSFTSRGKVADALTSVNSFAKIEMGRGSYFTPSKELDWIGEIYDEKLSQSLIKYPGALGEFFGNEFCRDSFVVFWGAAKSGKSYRLADVVWNSMLQHNRTAYFSVGDMSKPQVMKRLLQRACQHPMEDVGHSYRFPISMELLGGGSVPIVEFDYRKVESVLTEEDALRGWKKFLKRESINPDCLRVSVHSNDSISIRGILDILSEWERQDWVPDVVVLDYADLLTPIRSGTERDDINQTWKVMRKISQDFHCCFVTASQSDADAYDAEVMTRKNFSGDRRKNDHPTAIIGINRTDLEIDNQLCRLNYVVRRNKSFTSSEVIYVAECRDLTEMAVLSCWGNKS